MNITIKSELDGVKLVNDYRNMNSKAIIDALNDLITAGHIVTGIIDIDSKA